MASKKSRLGNAEALDHDSIALDVERRIRGVLKMPRHG
jgi:hypothetical protein